MNDNIRTRHVPPTAAELAAVAWRGLPEDQFKMYVTEVVDDQGAVVRTILRHMMQPEKSLAERMVEAWKTARGMEDPTKRMEGLKHALILGVIKSEKACIDAAVKFAQLGDDADRVLLGALLDFYEHLLNNLVSMGGNIPGMLLYIRKSLKEHGACSRAVKVVTLQLLWYKIALERPVPRKYLPRLEAFLKTVLADSQRQASEIDPAAEEGLAVVER